MHIARVVVSAKVDKPLDYLIPEEVLGSVEVGSTVEVPLRGRKTYAYVTELAKESPHPHLKTLLQVCNADCPLSPALFTLAQWMSSYYCTPLGQVLRLMAPPKIAAETKEKSQYAVVRKASYKELAAYAACNRKRAPAQSAIIDVLLQEKRSILLTELLEKSQTAKSCVDRLAEQGLLSLSRVQIDRSLEGVEYFRTKKKNLNQEQAAALAAIQHSLQQGSFHTHLLHGVTGSGKTEVYLQAIDSLLQQGSGAIMLVPEIALTPQTVERLRARFSANVAVLHSRLSTGERRDAYFRLAKGKAKVAVGPRSTLFCPVQRLRLIIVDEEQENSYKQTEQQPCYHARNAAVMRGKIEQAVVVLGSATPSLESFHNAKRGKYTLSTLSCRADSARLPTTKLIDMSLERNRHAQIFSEELIQAIQERYERGEQTILFLNRRGYHTQVACQECQEALSCPRCDLALTFHRNGKTLRCHLCGHEVSPPPACPLCQSPLLKFRGFGTEQVDLRLNALFPPLRTVRLDADTTKHRGSHEKLLQQFRSGKADVLIGTQMIAKGLHFPNVTLVGVLNSDASLHIPDFRATEQAFQLLTQVAGRAGRGVVPGEVLVQTRMPKHPLFSWAAREDYASFYIQEMEVRRAMELPPFTCMVKLGFKGKEANRTYAYAECIRKKLINLLPNNYTILPTQPSGYTKVKDQFRFQFLVKGPAIPPLSSAVMQILRDEKTPAEVRLLIDINPISTYF